MVFVDITVYCGNTGTQASGSKFSGRNLPERSERSDFFPKIRRGEMPSAELASVNSVENIFTLIRHRQAVIKKTDSVSESVLRLGSPARSFVDRSGRVGFDLGGGLYFTVVDPFEQFVFIEIDFTSLSAARYFSQTGKRVHGLFLFADDFAGFVDGYRPPLFSLRLKPVYRSLNLLQFGEDLPDRGRNVFKT